MQRLSQNSRGSLFLRPVRGQKLRIVPGLDCYLGASTSPGRIVVTAVEGNLVRYTFRPWMAEAAIDLESARDLIQSGTETWLKLYGDLSERPGADERFLNRYRALLAFVAGGDGPTADPEQLRGVRVLVRLADPMPGSEWKTADGVDRWSEVTGCAITSGYDSEKKAYDLEVAREDLAELRALPFGVCVLPLGEARP